MKHCHCGWSGDDSYTQCPNAAAHQKSSVATSLAGAERARLQAVAGAAPVGGLRGPVRHWLSHKIEVYQTEDGRYVTADGRRLPGQRKRLR